MDILFNYSSQYQTKRHHHDFIEELPALKILLVFLFLACCPRSDHPGQLDSTQIRLQIREAGKLLIVTRTARCLHWHFTKSSQNINIYIDSASYFSIRNYKNFYLNHIFLLFKNLKTLLKLKKQKVQRCCIWLNEEQQRLRGSGPFVNDVTQVEKRGSGSSIVLGFFRTMFQLRYWVVTSFCMQFRIWWDRWRH